MSTSSLTDEKYWSRVWSGTATGTCIDPVNGRLDNHANLARHRLLQRALHDVPRGSGLLEIGAGRSRWLPYFSRQFGFSVSGLDYSEIGCEAARRILSAANVPGDIVCADLFHPPATFEQAFDVVVSFGVVEHFESTATCLEACARYLKPGGRMVTTIPNMRGAIGLLQRWVDREVFQTHVPLTADELAAAHRVAGLDVSDSGYFLSTNWRVVACQSPSRGAALVRRALHAATTLCWSIDRLGLGPGPNGFTSPYIYCIADKPKASGQPAVRSADTDE